MSSQVTGVEISPTNLELMTEEEAYAVQHTYRQLLDQVDHPVYVYSVQSPLVINDYLHHIKQQSPGVENLQNEYYRYARSFQDRSIQSTDHYALTRVSSEASLLNFNDDTDLEGEADRVLTQFVEALNTADFDAEPVDQEQLSYLEDRFTGGFERRYLHTGERVRRFAVVTEFPEELELGWPLDILRLDGEFDVVQRIEPRNGGDTRTTLNRAKERVNAEIDSRVAGGFADTNKLEAKRGSIETMLDSLAKREQHPFNYTAVISAAGKTREQCDERFEKLESRLQMMGLDHREPILQTDQAAETCHPRKTHALNDDLLLLSDAAAAGLPFATHTIEQPTGIIYGEDHPGQIPVLQDRFTWRAPHLAKFGATGSGKTYHTKLELIRTRLTDPDTRIIVIDPKNEYHGLIDRLGGLVHTVSDRPSRIDTCCFQPPRRGHRSIDEYVDLIQHLYQVTTENQGRSLVVVDEAHNILNDEDGRRVLTRWIREARDTSTAITPVSQSASDFTDHREGRTLLDQCPGKLLFRHERVPQGMVDYFNLSNKETKEIYSLKTGSDSTYSQAILKISGRLDSKIRVTATNPEHRLIEQT